MASPRIPIARFAVDLVCPERCAACETIVDADDLFCERCMAEVRRLGPPECARCGSPATVSGICSPCVADPSPIRTARAWAAYREGTETSPVAAAIARFKYGGAQRLGRRMAAAMQARIPPSNSDLVIPVPLHARRLRERGYNQSAVLARHLGRRGGGRVALGLVTRTRPTPSQLTVSPGARASNVAHAFAVRRADLVTGRTVLLIDDVWTSGSTARAVAGALRSAGAVAVDVLTFARVL